jgi:hypothetical protein
MSAAGLSADPRKIPPFIPLDAPPPGIRSNFANPDPTRYHTLVATVAVTLTIALIFVLTRFYTRAFMVRQFGWDDGRTSPAHSAPAAAVFFQGPSN